MHREVFLFIDEYVIRDFVLVKDDCCSSCCKVEANATTGQRQPLEILKVGF